VANFAIVSNWTGSMIEGLEWLKVAIDRFRSLPPVEGEANGRRQAVLAKALFAQGMVSMASGNIHFARQSLDESIAITRLTGDKRLRGYALEISYVAAALLNPLDAVDYAEEGFAIFNEVGDPWGMSIALLNQARIALIHGDSETSQEYFGLLKARMTGTPVSFMSGTTYLGMGYAEREQGHYAAAKAYFEEGLGIFKQLRHKGFENVLFSEIGHIARLQGDSSQAKEIYRQTITRFHDLGNRAAVAHQLECFAHLAIVEENPRRAARLFGAAEALRQRIDSQMADHERLEYQWSLERLRAILTEGELEAFWAEGRTLTMEQAIEFAIG
jgi:tetratricopeptide (TPR) repeat protein